MRWLRVVWRMSLFFMVTIGSYWAVVIGRFMCRLRKKSWIGWRNRVVRRWSHLLVGITGGHLKVIGTPPKPPFVLVSNHLSYVDIPALFASVDGVFVAKQEVRSWPVLGRIVAGVNTLFVDRTRRQDVARVNQMIAEQLDAQQGLIIFPEGMSTQGAQVMPFKPSLLAFPAEQGVPVYYATITYRTPPGEVPAHLSVCWGMEEDIVFLKHLTRFFEISSFEAEVRYGSEPVMDSDRKILAEKLWHCVNKQFVPVVNKETVCPTSRS